MLEIREIFCQLQAGRSIDLKTYKIIIFGIGLFDVVSCNDLLLQHQVQPLKQLDMTKVTTLRHTKGKVPSNIVNFMFFLPLLLCRTFLSLVVTCLFLQTLGGRPPLHHSCCSGSWIDPAVLNVSRFRIVKVQIRSQYHRLLHGNFRLVGLQGKNFNVWSKKSTKYIESCFADLPKSPRIGKGERLCFHATCTSRL